MGGADTNYTLTIGQGTGVRGTFDTMAYHNGHAFTTRDHDHNTWNAANCYQANLNGKYVNHIPEDYNGSYSPHDTRLTWYDGNTHVHHYYTKVQIKIRPKRCSIA